MLSVKTNDGRLAFVQPRGGPHRENKKRFALAISSGNGRALPHRDRFPSGETCTFHLSSGKAEVRQLTLAVIGPLLSINEQFTFSTSFLLPSRNDLKMWQCYDTEKLEIPFSVCFVIAYQILSVCDETYSTLLSVPPLSFSVIHYLTIQWELNRSTDFRRK